MAEPERPQLSPYQVELEASKRYAWCRCGRSSLSATARTPARELKEPVILTAERTELRPF